AGGDAIPMTAEGNSSSRPRWSPDGKYLAFLSERNEGKTQIWLLDRRSGEEEQLTETIQDVDGFEWAPDSKRLALTFEDHPPDEEGPAWSPDGKQIAFSSNRSTPDPDRTPDSNIWVVTADNTDKGAHLTQVTTNPGEDESPAWSPDGKWIAYITQLDPKLYIYA